MSLDWSIEKVKDWEEVNTDEEWPVTNTLIWATMTIGMNRITETNWPDFYMRISMWENAFDTWMFKGNEETEGFDRIYITPEDVKRRIGLWTNASGLSRTKFHKKITDVLEREAEARLPR